MLKTNQIIEIYKNPKDANERLVQLNSEGWQVTCIDGTAMPTAPPPGSIQKPGQLYLEIYLTVVYTKTEIGPVQ